MVEGLEARERIERKLVEIDQSPLLKGLFDGEHVERDYEVELRFKPARELTREEIHALSEGKFRNIDQAYMFALNRLGQREIIRMRRTEPESEGSLLRVAYKKRIPHDKGRLECQVRFPPDDARAAEFEELWKRHEWNVLHKTRYYIDYVLPNGHLCQIHYDVHHGGALDGFTRIEVEFATDTDFQYVKERIAQGILPDWIGSDVTNDVQYGSKSLARVGLPK